MCKIIPSWVFRRFQYFRPHTSSRTSTVRTALIFSLLFPLAADILFTSSGLSLSSLAFAQTSADQADSQESHRLENFLISVKDAMNGLG